MSLFGFSSNPTVSINFINQATRKTKTHKVTGQPHEELLIYSGQESVVGTVEISSPGRKIDHLGIKIEMVGQIEPLFDRGNNIKFVAMVRELEAAGTILDSKVHSFDFPIEKPYETYNGANIIVRYFVRVTVSRSYGNSFVKDREIVVQNWQSPEVQAASAETPATPLKMEVGIEDCLHIEFEYDKGKYHLQDVVLGKIYFLLVRIKIKHMELAVIRRESAGAGSNSYNESENVVKYELMDGAPVKGECVPIRLFLAPLDLTPTYRSVNDLFSVKYFLNLVLIDEEDRRYFKQQEVVFWRKGDSTEPK